MMRMARRFPMLTWKRRWPPMRCCSAPSAGRNGTACPTTSAPEAGLLRLRKDMALFANLRPAICYPALADASSLKPELVEGLDILIVRELTGGVYFGEPKEITDLGNGQKRAVDTQVYDTYEIERIAAVAFELARTRGNKVCSMEKRNVMKSGVLWNEVVTATHKDGYADVELPHAGRRRRHAAGALAQAVRRHRHRQPVRRHAVRRRRHADRFARHAAVGLAGRGPTPRPASARRCTSRCTARRRTSPARAKPTRSP
jgi:hypothetical protein